MGIQVDWDNVEKTIILWTFEKEWNWDQFHAALDETNAMANQYEHQIDVLLDIQPTRIIPRDSSPLVHFQRGMDAATRQNGKVVMAGGNMVTRTLVDIFRKLYRQLGESFLTVPSLDEGRRLLDELRGRV